MHGLGALTFTLGRAPGEGGTENRSGPGKSPVNHGALEAPLRALALLDRHPEKAGRAARV